MRYLTVLPRLTFFLGQPNFKTGVVRILSISWLLVWYVGICWRPSNPWMASTHKAVKKSEEISIGSFLFCALYWTSKLCFVFVIHRPYCFLRCYIREKLEHISLGIIFWIIVMNGREIIYRNENTFFVFSKNKFHDNEKRLLAIKSWWKGAKCQKVLVFAVRVIILLVF